MLSHPIAKINLGLYVTGKRTDGYHDLETVFYPVLTGGAGLQPAFSAVEHAGCKPAPPVTDTLEVEPAERDTFELVGLPLAGDPMDNLVMRALRLLRQECSIPPVSVRLTKGIPSGAGLGGGSSDAAYMMRMLNEMFALGLSTDDMERRVATLGADCAFFVQGRPVLATGIGNIFQPIDVDLSGYEIRLVKPNDFVSTREAYSLVVPRRPAEPLAEALRRPVSEWRDHIFNDFEESVFAHHPAIREAKERLYREGAAFALMSGSGSTVFGLFARSEF